MSPHNRNQSPALTRREFQMAASSALAMSAGALGLQSAAAEPRNSPRGKAEACILLWLGGGMCHIDTFDPKAIGDPIANRTGSAYPSIETAIADARVCEHLSRTAPLLDRGVLLRSLNHPLKVDHADSANLMKTGRLTSGTVVYPSLGSLVAHQRGARGDDVPPYVVMGTPNVTRGPGFLGSRFGYLYLTDVTSGPTGLRAAADVNASRLERRQDLLNLLRSKARRRAEGDPTTEEYDAAIDAARKLMNGPFVKVFNMDDESDQIRARYGSPFGQRCLMARRLVESGVRFVEAAYDLNFKNGTGWDTHRQGQKNQHLLIEDLDQALSALIEDLESRRLLDSTLVVVATEFGRPAEFDGQGGRGHQSKAFSCALFGGGLRTGRAIGTTDQWGAEIVDQPVSVPDFHATILATLGIDPAKELYDGNRPIPFTDHGKPLHELFH